MTACAKLPNHMSLTMRPEQNECYFSDDMFKCVLLQTFLFFIQISLNHDCLTDNKLALVCIMACRLLGVKPLPEPEMTEFNDAFIHHQASAC